MTIPKAALTPSHDPPIGMVRADVKDAIPVSPSELGLNDKRNPWSVELAAAGDDEANIEQESRLTENRCKGNRDVIAQEGKLTVKEFVPNDKCTIVEEALDKYLRRKFRNAKSWVLYNAWNVLEKVILNLLREDVIQEAKDVHIAKSFHSYEAGKRIIGEAVALNFLDGAYSDFCQT